MLTAALRIGRAVPYGFLTTVDDNVLTRLVQHLEVTDDAVVTFSTDPTSRKAVALAANPEVTYGVFDREGLAAVTVYGTASFDRDPDRRFELWTEDLSHFYAGPEDNRYVLVTIEPSTERGVVSG